MSLLICAIFGAILTFICFHFVVYFNFQQPLKKYPKFSLIQLVNAVVKVHRTKNFLPIIFEYMKTIGTIARIDTFGIFPSILVVSNVKFIERLLGGNKILAKAENYFYLKGWIGDGLVISNGDKWRSHRKLLSTAFHFELLEQFTAVFDVNGQILVEKLKKEVGRDSFDIYPLINLCTLDIICETAMGTSVNAQINSESEYVQSVHEMCILVTRRTMSPHKVYQKMYECSRDYQEELKALKVIHSFTNRVIRERKAILNLNKDNVEVDEFGRQRKHTLLDLLLQSQIRGNSITDKEINEEVNTFLFGGYDTVTSAVSFALYSIANHFDVQEKVVDELQTIFANDFYRNATYQDLISMKYLEAVIKETLRLYPSVPLFGRRTDSEIEFGQKFAMLEMKSLIAKVVRQFELLPAVPEHKLEPYVTLVLKSKNGMCIKLKPRSGE